MSSPWSRAQWLGNALTHTLKQYKIQKRIENALNNNNHESIECYNNVDNLQFKMITKVFSSHRRLFKCIFSTFSRWNQKSDQLSARNQYLNVNLLLFVVWDNRWNVRLLLFALCPALVLLRAVAIRHCNEWFRYKYQNNKSNGRTLFWCDEHWSEEWCRDARKTTI